MARSRSGATEAKAWERQEGESEKAYEAFFCYLNMENRSLAKVGQELGKSTTLMERWSSKFSWTSRVRDYEDSIKKEAVRKKRKERTEMYTRQIQTATLLQKKAVEALTKLDVEAMAPKDILNFISKGAQLERLMRDIDVADQEKESGMSGDSSSLADTIVEAYRKRMEGGAE